VDVPAGALLLGSVIEPLYPEGPETANAPPAAGTGSFADTQAAAAVVGVAVGFGVAVAVGDALGCAEGEPLGRGVGVAFAMLREPVPTTYCGEHAVATVADISAVQSARTVKDVMSQPSLRRRAGKR
jgi:hypothetical protein